MDIDLMDSSTQKNLKELASSLYFTIALLKECNYKCAYCYPFGQNKVVGTNMSFGEAKGVLDAATEVGFNKIKFTGGEPTLVPWFSDLFEYAITLNDKLSITVITNGSNLSRHIDLFEKYKNNLSLQFSLDSINDSNKKHGLFKILTSEVNKNLSELSKRGIKTRINMVITQDNKGEIFDIIDVASKFGFSIKLFNLFYQNEYIATHTRYKISDGSYKSAEDYWKSKYFNLNEIIPELKSRSSQQIVHYEGDGKFGISYGFIINNVDVLIADTTKGAYYQNEICQKTCKYFRTFCEKGFYNPHVSANLTLYPDDCYNSELRKDLKGMTHIQKVSAIRELLSLFSDVSFVPRPINPIFNLLNQTR